MDQEDKDEVEQLWTVRIRHHHKTDIIPDLTFGDGMRLIQRRFEDTKGAVHFASIEHQMETKTNG